MSVYTNRDQSRQRLLIRRWVIGLTLLAVVLHQLGYFLWRGKFFAGINPFLLDFVILSIGVAVYFGLDRMLDLVEENRGLKADLQEAEKKAAEAYQRLSVVFRTSQMFAEVGEEREVVELLLRLTTQLAGARGASFVPLDERGQTLPALSYGELPNPEVDAWVEYLASPAVRQQCQSCHNHEQLTLACPLLQGTFSGTTGAYCLPLRRGGREYGVLNLYVPQNAEMNPDAQDILRTIVDETTLAFEGLRLRRRELATLRQLQAVREKADLKTLLSSLLKTLQESVEADFAMAVLWDGDDRQPKITVSTSALPENAQHLVEGILHSVLISRKPVLLGNVAGELASSPGFRSLIAAPLVVQDQPAMGALFVANQRSKTFSQHQLTMLQRITGQVAMVVQNFDLIAELEYKTMIEERTRLAREIHDGLAQTLGYLKLKAAQMVSYLEHNELDQLRKTVQTTYESLSEAYLDVRQAIDGLRVASTDTGIAGWLLQTAKEFQDYSELTVHVCEPIAVVDLPSEVHAQLIRILQEALSNVRKHGQASQVWISAEINAGNLILEVKDDGVGFCPDDVPGPSQHGLRGMRERAELIGADFQVIGSPLGTVVQVRLPLEIGEEVQ